jgi:hypothetical protein
MVGHLRRIITGAWLLGTVAVAPIVQAQPAQTWSDPPPDLNVTPLTVPSEAAKPVETQGRPDPAKRRRPETKTTRSSPTPDSNRTGLGRAASRDTSEVAQAAAARRVREKQTATRKLRQEQAERAREQQAERVRQEQVERTLEERAERVRQEHADKARAERAERIRQEQEAQARRLAAARERRQVAQPAATARRAQAPQQTRYEVMRLRTLLLPDGRTVEVLTRPDQRLEDLLFE